MSFPAEGPSSDAGEEHVGHLVKSTATRSPNLFAVSRQLAKHTLMISGVTVTSEGLERLSCSEDLVDDAKWLDSMLRTDACCSLSQFNLWVSQMIPYGLSEEQFVSMYRRKLDRLAGQAISEIRELLSRPIEPGVTEARVEIFLDEYFGAPSVWAYWHGRNNKVDQADPNLFPGRSMQLRLEMQDLSSIDSQYFVEPEEFPGLRISASLISRWFAECWWKAGGWFYPVPVTLAVHDFDSHGSAVLSEGNT